MYKMLLYTWSPVYDYSFEYILPMLQVSNLDLEIRSLTIYLCDSFRLYFMP